jgi:hypothetical protein
LFTHFHRCLGRLDVVVVSVGAGGSPGIPQPFRRRHPLGMHEMLGRLVMALHLEGRKQSSLLCGGLLCCHIVRQAGVELLIIVFLVVRLGCLNILISDT